MTKASGNSRISSEAVFLTAIIEVPAYLEMTPPSRESVSLIERTETIPVLRASTLNQMLKAMFDVLEMQRYDYHEKTARQADAKRFNQTLRDQWTAMGSEGSKDARKPEKPPPFMDFFCPDDTDSGQAVAMFWDDANDVPPPPRPPPLRVEFGKPLPPALASLTESELMEVLVKKAQEVGQSPERFLGHVQKLQRLRSEHEGQRLSKVDSRAIATKVILGDMLSDLGISANISLTE